MARDLLASRPVVPNSNLSARQPRDLLANRQTFVNKKNETPQHIGAPMQESQGLSGIGQDLMGYISRSLNPNPSSGRNDLLNNIKSNNLGVNFKGAMDEVSGFGQQVARMPIEAIQAPFTGQAPRLTKNFYKGAEGLANIPSAIAGYLGKKGIIYPEIGEAIHIPEHEFGLGKKQPGDFLAQQIPGAALPFYKKPLTRVNEKLAKTLQNIEKTNLEHAQILGPGKEHGAHISQQFLDAIEGKINPETGKRVGGLRHEIGSQYDKLANDMKETNVVMHVTPDMKPILKEIKKLGKGVPEQAKNAYLKAMIKASSKSEISGADALNAYREIKHQKNNAFKEASASNTGASPEVRKKYIKEYNDYKKLEENLRDELAKQIGPEYIKRLKTIDKEFATKIAPLYDNPMYQEMLKHGQTSKNVMKVLHGTTPGNAILKNIVKENPSLQENIVGQRFAEKPENLTKPSELLDYYASISPRISKLIKEQNKLRELKTKKVPELEQAIKNMQAKKLARTNQGKGALKTLGTLGTGLAIEAGFGRDWKEDIPGLAALRMLLSGNKYHK